MAQSSKKIAAIYDLREAAEAKANAETALEQSATPATRSALLDAQIELEHKTAEAVDVCHDCDEPEHAHDRDSSAGSSAAPRTANARDNVIEVDFGREH